ncbi:uncharacterized protein LOC142401950 [Odontesthes bonariensis]|uniref:uncharacterized protein LOC142401950 n=1 Tax=Odontesthes bonariensis TaxID=219752 RepID=UPI003F58AF45
MPKEESLLRKDGVRNGVKGCNQIEEDKGKPSYEMMECDPDWAPSLHLGHTEAGVDTERYRRRMNQQQPPECRHTPSTETASTETPASPPPPSNEDDGDDTSDTLSSSVDMDQGEQECSFCCQRRAEINRLLAENQHLKEELSKKNMTESFLENEEKVNYYTGIPCLAVLMGVLAEISPCLKIGRKLTAFQMLLLTLMRLRLNLPIQHLADLFSICRKTASTTIRDTVSTLNSHLSPLIHWPEREFLRGSMPHQFVEAFGNRVAVIVDCFEIGMERASNLTAQCKTFSRYKHKHTIKYLIGCTPQGAVSFISKGWGGRASDKHITECSGMLRKLLPGDILLADRGFDIDENVGFMCAEVKTPAFTRGLCQLEAKDVEETRKIAHLRVHVERVIGCIRNKYTILNGTTPVVAVLPGEGEDRMLLDKIVWVCCALTNMCSSIVVKPL